MPGESPESWDRTATVPLRPVGVGTRAARWPRTVRVLEATAGLLSAGLLVSAVLLLVLKFAAPGLVSGQGLSATDGPESSRIAVGLVAGVVGEVLHRIRGRLPGGLRPVVAALVIGGVLAALWWCWWS